MNKAVVFDLGGVLIDWNPRYLYRKLIPDEAEMEQFLSTICTPDWNEQQDAGRPVAEAVADRLAHWPEAEPLIRAFYGRFDEMLGGALDETVAVLADLKAQGVPCYALSNWSAETYPHATSRFPFLDGFEGKIISGREGMKKPDARIFYLLRDRFGLHLPDTAFIDDRMDNVEAARAVGLWGIHFTTASALRKDLQAFGVLDPQTT